MRKVIVVLATATAIVAWGGTGVAGAQGPPKSPREVMKAYTDDFNRGDAAAAASHFSRDAVFTTPLGVVLPALDGTSFKRS